MGKIKKYYIGFGILLVVIILLIGLLCINHNANVIKGTIIESKSNQANGLIAFQIETENEEVIWIHLTDETSIKGIGDKDNICKMMSVTVKIDGDLRASEGEKYYNAKYVLVNSQEE